MNSAFARILCAAGLTLLGCSSAQAIIIDGAITGGSALTRGGTFQELPVPFSAPVTGDASVGNDTFQTPDLYGFNEDQNIIVPSNLAVDVGSTIAAGSVVASHYIFFDPGPSTSVVGYVNFDAQILGILTSTAKLAATDFLANTGVTYLNPGLRGLEAGDTATIDSGNANRLLVSFTASTPGDYIRVLTAESPGAGVPPRSIPEPSTVALLSMAALGAGLAGRRRKRT